MKNVLSFAIGLMVVAMMVGCGGGQQPAPKTEKPAEPAFVAQVMTMPAMKVASLTKMGPYSDYGKSLAELLTIAEKDKVTATGNPFGIYYDNPANVKPESARYEVCVPVAPETKNKADKKTGFAIKDAPEMMVAATDYMGPYANVAPTYQKLYQWVGENKYEPAGPMVEFYLNDPAKTKPESLMTRIGAVVKPMAPATDTTKKAEEPKKEEPKAPTGK